MWWHTTDTVFDIFKLSILSFILTLNLKSEFCKVLAFIPNPSEPNNNTFLPFQSFLVKSFVADTSNALIQNSFDFKFRVQMNDTIESLNISNTVSVVCHHIFQTKNRD